jgi:transposase
MRAAGGLRRQFQPYTPLAEFRKALTSSPPLLPQVRTQPPPYPLLKTLQPRKASVQPHRRIVAISDNAQYHRSRLHLDWRHQQAPHFGLDFLPPYSPELNPIERVWKLTRRLCLHNRYFAFLDSVAEAVEGRFTQWINPNETLRHLCAIT